MYDNEGMIGDQALQQGSGENTDVPKGKSIADLNTIFQKAEDADRETFAEMRSNVLLCAGEHYTKKNNRFWNRLRDSRQLNVEKKLRLTKNHIQKITKIYRNNILKYSPGVKVLPQLDSELQDVKSAEIHQSVWEHGKRQTNFKKNIARWAQDFVDIGECAVKVFWDPSKGTLVGYEPMVDEEGNMFADEMGQPLPDHDRPVFSGAMVHERVLAFNLLRDPDAKTLEDSPYAIVRKMIGYNDLKDKIEDPKKVEKIEKSKDETFLVFDGANGKYEQSNNQVLLREYYWRPCPEYPRGYFYVATKDVILWQGELPDGIFPVVWEGFDEVQTTPRGRAIVKVLRPYQAEINRAASQAATHQVTLGDDKLVINNSAKVTQGGQLPGVRVIKTNSVGVNGGIHVLPGRAGEQFVGYIAGQIDEMYNVANVAEDNIRKADGAMDIWGQLYGSIKSKKEFSIYTDKFEGFLSEVCLTSLRLYRHHLDENAVIQYVGKREIVNIEEYKNMDDLQFQIKVEPATDDASTIMGKQLMINHTLQYVGDKLGPDEIGKLLRTSPVGNFEQTFDDMTVDYDTAKNDILQLERGQMPNLNKYENTMYKIKSITGRMKQPDFDFLAPEVQQLFQEYLSICERVEAEKVAEIQRAEAGFIPTDGYMVKADFYVTDAEGKTKRATLPYASMEWLVKKLEEQGASQQALEGIGNNGAFADMSQMVAESQQGQQAGGTLPNL